MLDIIRSKSRSLGVKIIFGVIIIVFVFWGASAVNTPTASVMATVNDVSITSADFQAEYYYAMKMMEGSPGFPPTDAEQKEAIGQELLGSMIANELVRQESERLGLDISDNELSYLVTRMPQFFGESGKFDPDKYRQILAMGGQTPGFFERRLSSDLVIGRLQDYLTNSVTLDPDEARSAFNFENETRIVQYIPFPATDFLDKVTLDDSEVVAYYEQYKNSYDVPARADFDYLLFSVGNIAAGLSFSDAELEEYYNSRKSSFALPARFHARHILIALEDAEDAAKAEENARARAGKVADEIRAGRNFTELAAEYSADPGSRERGGDLGWLNAGQTVPEFEEAVWSLAPGQVSAPVRSSFGFHIIRLEEKQAASERSFAEAREEVLAMKREDEAFRLMDQYLRDVEDEIITIKDMDAIAAKYGLKVQQTGFDDIGAISETLGAPDTFFLNLDKTQAGGILPIPLEVNDSFIVLKLNRYQAAYTPDLDEARERIVAELKNDAAHRMALEEAEKAAAGIAASGTVPPALAGKVAETRPVNRFYEITGLGYQPVLAEAIFAAETGKWNPRSFSTENGAVIFRVSEVLAPTNAQWAELGARFTDQLLRNMRMNMYNSYVSMLARQASIEVKVERIFTR